MSEETVDNPGVIAFPPALFAGTLALGLLLHFIFPVNVLPHLIAIALGVVVLVSAALIAISSFRAMRRAQTAVNPSRPTTAIVSDGAFSFSRNPIYLSLTLLDVGIALLFNALWALLILLPLVVVVQNGVIKREERYLEQKFGDEYLRYKASVRRWV
ncbi:MAG: isoprenylcysteine carboxylmethyltransferase family protein [Rhizonema sp. PD37]|nr:isoprenylcysteine carboxylmethyltransferase family protein [Rhizonema sp. PD37]